NVSERFGERLARLREERGMRPHVLAQRIGATEGMIRKIEAGETKSANFPNGLLLARALGCDPWYLAFGQDGPPPIVGGEAPANFEKLARDLSELRATL